MEEFLRDIEISGSEQDFQDVFLSVGVCLFLAQNLEHNIVAIVLFMDFIPKGLKDENVKARWEESVEEYEKQVWQLTLGRLIGRLRTVNPPEDEIFERLEKCRERRNWLAHHFFRDRIAKLFSVEGRQETLQIIEVDKKLFEETNKILTERVLSLLEKTGYKKEVVRELAVKLLAGENIMPSSQG